MAQQKLQAIKEERIQKLESLKKIGINHIPQKLI